MNVHVEKYGKGKPFVFFHGFGFDSTIWFPFLDKVKEHITCFLVDLPGFGNTPWMDFEVFLKELQKLLPERFALVGWSLGGLYALRFSNIFSERIEALFLLASSPCFIKKEEWPGIEASVFNAFFNRLSNNREETLSQFVALQTRGSASKYLSFPLGKASEEGLKKGLHALQHWDERIYFSKLNLPISCLFGGLDSIVPSSVFSHIEKSYPHVKSCLLKKASHIPFLSHDEFVAEWLLSYMR